MFISVKRNLSLILGIIYPVFCAVCRKKITTPDALPVCPECLCAIKLCVSPLCKTCGIPLEKSATRNQQCARCTRTRFSFDQALSACMYEGTVRTCIHLMKYNRRRTLGGVLAEKMRECIEKHIAVPYIDIITPVPLHWKKINDRGFNQAQIFAEHLAQTLHVGCSAGNLIRVRKTRSQFSLKKEQRPDNVHGAFSCRNSAEFQGKKILLIDDIFTTGATANECARILKNAGAARVIALSLARS